MRHTAALVTAGTALALVAWVRPARAEGAETERARALFDEAGELERAGQWRPAQERLRAALRLRETPQLHYALGWALENDDKLLEAKIEYETAKRTASEVPGAAEVARLGAERLAELEKKTPLIKIQVGGSKGRLRIVVDGREVGSAATSVAVAVNPGSHVVRVERGPGGILERVVYVGRRAVRSVDVDAELPVTARDRAQPRHARPGARSTKLAPTNGAARAGASDDVVPVVLLSGGIASILTGGALLVSSASDDARGGDGVRTKEAIGVAAGGLGIVASAVGAVLLSTGRRASSDKRGARARAGITPIAGGALGSAGITF